MSNLHIASSFEFVNIKSETLHNCPISTEHLMHFSISNYTHEFQIYFSFLRNSVTWRYNTKEQRDYEYNYLKYILADTIPPMPKLETLEETNQEDTVEKEPKEVFVYRKEEDFFVTDDKSTIDNNTHFEKAKYLE